VFSTRGIKLFSHLSAILLTTSLENIQSSNDQKNFGITHFKDIPSCYAWPHPDNSETSITSGWGCQSEVDVEYFQLLAFLQSNDSITACYISNSKMAKHLTFVVPHVSGQ